MAGIEVLCDGRATRGVWKVTVAYMAMMLRLVEGGGHLRKDHGSEWPITLLARAPTELTGSV